MATTTACLDKALNIIYTSEWKERREDEAYWLLHKTESKVGHLVTAEWSGRIYSANRIPKARWAPWALEVKMVIKNDANGTPLVEPIIKRDDLACQRFVTLEELEKAYNAFRQKYCTIGGEVMPTVALTAGESDPTPVAPVEEETDDEDDEDASEHSESAKASVIDTDASPTILPPTGSDKVSGDMGGDW